MLLYLYLNDDGVVVKTTKNKINTNRYFVIRAEVNDPADVVDKIYPVASASPYKEDRFGFRLAVICNWDDQCGISTYTKYLIDSLSTKVDEIGIFSEQNACQNKSKVYEVDYCWRRGQSMRETVRKVLDWKPTVVLVQHEFGLFPRASYFLPMLEQLSSIPYVITLHSVYEHRDKSICTSNIKNMIVHSASAEKCLRKLGNKNHIDVIPHGCVEFPNVARNWNIIGVPYTICQLGFGFAYKGVDVALEAVRLLIDRDPKKYKDLFYCFYCSENEHCKNANDLYYQQVSDKIVDLGLQENASIQRGFQSDEQVNEIFRTYKLAVFPYVTDPKSVVYGSSGIVKIAMANDIPVVVSSSRMFDDVDGVLPRPKDASELAEKVHRVYSDSRVGESMLQKQREYLAENSWPITADRYLEALKGAVERF